MIIAIDPGNIKSAYALMDTSSYAPVLADIVPNESMPWGELMARPVKAVVIEMIASYGMPVGREVFDTCIWIGRFSLLAEQAGLPVHYLPRIKVKQNICHDSRAKDGNIRQALIDRFGVVGTKKNPGWFYGFKADMWAAYAVGTTFIDTVYGE